MDLHELGAALRRRWYLLLAGLLVTAGLAGSATRFVAPTYDIQASVVLVPSKGVIVEGGNPFLYLSGLIQARDVLVRTLNSSEVRDPIAERQPGATVEVQADATTSGPMIVILAHAERPETAEGALQAMLTALPRHLTQLQDEVGTPPTARINALTLTVDDQATARTGDQMRVVLAVAGVGVVGTVLLTGLVDGLMLARSRRRSSGLRPGQPAADPSGHAGAIEPGLRSEPEVAARPQPRESLATSPGPPPR